MGMTIGTQRFLASLSVATFLLASAARADNRAANLAPRSDYASMAAGLQAVILHQMEDKQLPAFSIALVDGNQIVWAQGFGYEDPEHKTPATAHTVYRVG